MPRDQEIELKLDVNRESLPRIKAHPLFGDGEVLTRSIPSVYFDTDDFELRDAGLSLRVRRTGGAYVQTIKSNTFGNPMLRGEWEQKINGPNPDLKAIRDKPLKRVLKKTDATIKPIFETSVRRSMRQLNNAGSTIELALDIGEISAGDRSETLCELELELKNGSPKALFELARNLSETVPMLVSVRSKAERGYTILERQSPKSEKALAVPVLPSCSAGQAFQMIARVCIRQVLANRPGVLAGDAEAVHQMRIGLRRLRTAISLFDELLADDQRESIKQELKWVTGELGPARELDVLQSEVLDPLSTVIPRDAGRVEAKEEFELRRQRAHEAAAKAVDSRRFAATILSVAEWVEAGPWTSSRDPLMSARKKTPAKEHAAVELARRRKKIRKQAREISELSPRQRHKLRIRAKKLRYASEFFKDVFPGKKNARRRKSMISALKELQTALGGLNDINSREHLMSDVPKRHPVSPRTSERRLSFAAGVMYGSQEAQVSDLMVLAKKAQATFQETKAFWN